MTFIKSVFSKIFTQHEETHDDRAAILGADNPEVTVASSTIGSQVSELTPSQLKELTKRLAIAERYRVLNIVNNQKSNAAPEDITISRHIESARGYLPELTRKSDRRIGLPLKSMASSWHASTGISSLDVISSKATYSNLLHSRHLEVTSGRPFGSTLKTISASELKEILTTFRKSNPDERIDLSAVLQAKEYSSEISHYNFFDSKLLKNCRLEGVTFTSCRFDWAHFSDSELKNTKFYGCKLLNASFMNASLSDCEFTNCNIRESMFVAAKLNSTKFSKCDIISSNFEDSIIKNSTFENVTLLGTHFLEAEISKSTIRDSNLKNAVFFGNLQRFDVSPETAATAVVTKPITAMPVYSETRGITAPKAYMKLDQSAQTIPLRIGMQAQRTTKEQVNNEAETILADIKKGADRNTPIAQQLLRAAKEEPEKYPGIAIILAKADKMAKICNAFYLPGGEDIPASLYGERDHAKNTWGGDYRRSLLELALIDKATNQGISIMAICRGFQMANVYFGANLIQDLMPRHKGVQKFSPVAQETLGLYGAVFKKTLLSTVAHHQAVPVTSGPVQDLETSVIYKNLIKASERKHGAPAIMLQFHPEFYGANSAGSLLHVISDGGVTAIMSKSNETFWKILSDAATAHKNAKEARAELMGTSKNLPSHGMISPCQS